MTVLLVIAIAMLFGVGAWLLMGTDLIGATIGAVLLGHGVLLLLVGPRQAGTAPLLGPGGRIPDGISDPLPQALGLTAIVISFAVATLLLAAAGRLGSPPGEDAVDDGEDPTAASADGGERHESDEVLV